MREVSSMTVVNRDTVKAEIGYAGKLASIDEGRRANQKVGSLVLYRPYDLEACVILQTGE